MDKALSYATRGLGLWVIIKSGLILFRIRPFLFRLWGGLVILAAEWGHGRRGGWLSNLHLGARDSESGGFVMLGKTFKGLTDEMLKWQTQKFLGMEIARNDYTIFVAPELVAEAAFGDIQESPRYPGGLALRFARVKRYRESVPGSTSSPRTDHDI